MNNLRVKIINRNIVCIVKLKKKVCETLKIECSKKKKKLWKSNTVLLFFYVSRYSKREVSSPIVFNQTSDIYNLFI